jgi:small conductance mechanosensitive channel
MRAMSLAYLFLAAASDAPDASLQKVEAFGDKVMDALPKIGIALIILLFGWWLAGRIKAMVVRVFVRRHVEPTVGSFVAQLSYWLLVVLAAVFALEEVFPTMSTTLVTVLGASTLAVGLALQNSLTNFAAGMMIILARHFRAGDSIEAGGVTGIVEAIGIFDTILITDDNRKIIVPNGKILGGPIVNTSAKSTRRLDLVISIAYGADLKRAKEIILSALKADARVLPTPAPTVAMGALSENSVDLAMQAWVAVGDYNALRSDVLEKVKLGFDAAGVAFPPPPS